MNDEKHPLAPVARSLMDEAGELFSLADHFHDLSRHALQASGLKLLQATEIMKVIDPANAAEYDKHTENIRARIAKRAKSPEPKEQVANPT